MVESAITFNRKDSHYAKIASVQIKLTPSCVIMNRKIKIFQKNNEIKRHYSIFKVYFIYLSLILSFEICLNHSISIMFSSTDISAVIITGLELFKATSAFSVTKSTSLLFNN